MLKDTVKDMLSRDGLTVSFEVFPPKEELSEEAIRKVVQELSVLHPDYISVTCSAGGSGNSSNTASVASLIQDEFGITAVAHMTCVNVEHGSLADSIKELESRGIGNVLALRGDFPDKKQPSGYRLAKDLIPTLKHAGFCVGAAAYPEGHIDCDDQAKNLDHLKQKQDAGADFFVTQLAFDNELIYRFLDAADCAGVTAPVACGIMPFMSKSQIQRMVFMCGVSLPSPVIKLLARYEDDQNALLKAGIEYACKQIMSLAEHGVSCIHVYCMNKPEVARSAVTALKEAGFRA